MPETASQMLRVAAARADFLDSGRAGAAGVPDLVAASWERSQAAGVDTGRGQSDFGEIDTGSLLARCAHPVLEQLTLDTVDLPIVIALTDSRARVLRRIDSSVPVGRLLDRVDLAPGFDYSESMMGTNGIGTVFEAGQPVSVVGPEHFTEPLQPFACTGAPIIDPVTGRVEGVLDISSLSHTWSPVMHALVRSAAKDISRNLLMDRSQAQRAIFETYLHFAGKAARRAVLAFGDSVFMANNLAQALFDSKDQDTIREHAMFLMRNRDRVRDTLVLSGERTVHMRGTRILVGSQLAGLVVIADVVTQQNSPENVARDLEFAERVLPPVAVATQRTSELVDDLHRPPRQIAGGKAPAWVRACAELREALERQRPAVVMGETGSGKFTLVAEVFHGLYPGAHSVCVDASQLDFQGRAEGDIEPLLHLGQEPTLHIVRNIDQASTGAVERLSSFFSVVARCEGPVWFTATLSDSSLSSDLPFQSLLSHFEVAITVPPLRLRSADLRPVTAALLQEIAPDRRVRLSPDAERVIARYSWPRNVSQLRDALVHALQRRPVGEIQAQDLPGYCQALGRRALTPIAEAERDAIVTALTEHRGNRVAAAAHLGMSRSSLYRKIKSYGILG